MDDRELMPYDMSAPAVQRACLHIPATTCIPEESNPAAGALAILQERSVGGAPAVQSATQHPGHTATCACTLLTIRSTLGKLPPRSPLAGNDRRSGSPDKCTYNWAK